MKKNVEELYKIILEVREQEELEKNNVEHIVYTIEELGTMLSQDEIIGLKNEIELYKSNHA